MKFNHYGVPTEEDREGAGFQPFLKLHYSSSVNPLFRIEHLKFEPDCIFDKRITRAPHLAFEVEDLAESIDALKGAQLLQPPTPVSDRLTIAYVMIEGVVVELMMFKKD